MLASVKKGIFFTLKLLFFSRCSVQREKKEIESEKKLFQREKK
jgi:hypothetical protein